MNWLAIGLSSWYDQSIKRIRWAKENSNVNKLLLKGVSPSADWSAMKATVINSYRNINMQIYRFLHFLIYFLKNFFINAREGKGSFGKSWHQQGDSQLNP